MRPTSAASCASRGLPGLLLSLALGRGLGAQAAERPLASSGSLDDASLRRAIQRIARESRGRLGVGIELLESGQRLIVGAGTRHPMQSVYKAPIGMAVLHAVDTHTLGLDDEVEVRPSDFVSAGQHSPIRDAHPEGTRAPLREVLRLAVSESDGTASDVLLRVLGGPSRVMSYLRGIGVRDVHVVTTEKAIGLDERVQFQDWTTPEGSLDFLRALYGTGSLADSSRALLLRFMTESPTGLQRLRGLLPAGTVVAHKTGSSGAIGGLTAATNDIGIVTLPDGCHLAVAVLLTDSRADAVARDRVIAEVARAAWDYWTDPLRARRLAARCGRAADGARSPGSVM